MFILMVVLFIIGYAAIALEHPIKIDKAASALLLGSVMWVVYMLGVDGILSLGHSAAWNEYAAALTNPATLQDMQNFVTHSEVVHHLSEIAQILFFLLGAMTIVEIVDQHEGFKIITDRIHTTNKVKLLWILSILTFFMSSVLDNLTTTIVMIALIRKLIDDKETRWFYAGMVVLAANAGGAFSPIGDVTTIMLWIGGQITAAKIILGVFIPSLLNILVPLIALSFIMKGSVSKPVVSDENSKEFTSHKEQLTILILGVSALLFVPVFKTLTHLPPYMGMLLGLGVLWVVTEIMHKHKEGEDKRKLSVVAILTRVDVPTVLFFLGILSAVAAMQSAGQLAVMAQFLDDKLGNVYLIGAAIGLLSAIIDNVPLVAGAMGMYPVEAAGATGYAANFVQDGVFWEYLAYTAGTGGSILIIGSAAGVAAMGLEKIDFIWYLKRISWLALLGYFAGVLFYWFEMTVLH